MHLSAAQIACVSLLGVVALCYYNIVGQGLHGFRGTMAILRKGSDDDAHPKNPPALSAAQKRAIAANSMVPMEHIEQVVALVAHLNVHSIPGSLVECGVWKGGVAMAMAWAQLGSGPTRDVFLFDTFEGMTRPTEKDGAIAQSLFKDSIDGKPRPEGGDWHSDGGGTTWCFGAIEGVRENMKGTGYPVSRVHLVKGDVLHTLRNSSTGPIALLRLDTDFYESTREELALLYPRLSVGGFLIVDDYHAWEGSRKATDEFLLAAQSCLVQLTVHPRPVWRRLCAET